MRSAYCALSLECYQYSNLLAHNSNFFVDRVLHALISCTILPPTTTEGVWMNNQLSMS